MPQVSYEVQPPLGLENINIVLFLSTKKEDREFFDKLLRKNPRLNDSFIKLTAITEHINELNKQYLEEQKDIEKEITRIMLNE